MSTHSPAYRAGAGLRRVVRLTLGVLAGAALFVAPAVPAGVSTARAADSTPDGSIGLRLLDVPGSAVGDPRAQLYVVDHLAPGATIQRRIEVASSSDTTTHVELYAAGATIVNGTFLGAEGRAPNELSSWTSVDPGASDVPADGDVTATVTIAVPPDAAPGERYGVVWAEVRSARDTSSGVTQVSRVGIRLYLSVGPGGPPAAEFTLDSLTALRSASGRPVVRASVHNTGGRALDMSGTLQLSDGQGGLSAGPFSADLGTTVAIGATENVTILLDPLVPAGPWVAEITLHSGLLEHTAHATITFPDSGAASATATPTTQARWPALAIAGLAILLLGAAAAILVLLRRGESARAARR
ncbi:MAG TPA: hypothetical protein VMV41_05550 [Cellulomonadaceae bacterium]|nr:hypothetical protein [Cellulomonadaceae bacterium]